LLYQTNPDSGPLLSQPLGGGPPETLIACVSGIAVPVTPAGVYYLPCRPPTDGTVTVHLMDPSTHRDREMWRLEHYSFDPALGGFAVSPDGQTILYEREVQSGADLMMIEHFK